MKYIIKNTDLFLNGKLIPEGRSVELSKQDAEILSEFIQEDKKTDDNRKERIKSIKKIFNVHYSF